MANAAWAQDADWGTLVWLTFITGARRGELVGLAWEHADLISSLLTIRRSLVRRNGKTMLKDTKTHQMRVIKLDQDTITIRSQHKARAEQRCADLGTTLDDDAFVFSYTPDHRRHCDPDAITHRYAKMAADLGIDTHLHALRHYSATELLAGGVDLRTVAGRLGHAGGGATTLKVYAAWLAGADTKAADLIASRLPRPPQVLDADDAGLNPSHSPAEPVTGCADKSGRLGAYVKPCSDEQVLGGSYRGPTMCVGWVRHIVRRQTDDHAPAWLVSVIRATEAGSTASETKDGRSP